MKLSSRMKILVIDDSIEARNVLKHLLRKKGFSNVHEAADGNDALQALHEAQEFSEPFELVLCDWNMPKMTGLGLLQQIRGEAAFVKLPFIMITVEGDRDKVIEAVRGGVNNYLVKPISGDKLYRKIYETFAKI